MAAMAVTGAVFGSTASPCSSLRSERVNVEASLRLSAFNGSPLRNSTTVRVAMAKSVVITARSTERAAEKRRGRGSPGRRHGNAKKASSLDRIELQAKSSIEKLKDILYRLKSRAPSAPEMDAERELSSSMSQSAINSEAIVINKEREVYISKKIEVDLSTDIPVDAKVSLEEDAEVALNDRNSKVEVSFPKPGLVESSIQLDAITYTNTTVQFDEDSQTAIVTVSATVREADLVGDREAYADRAVAMATRALARTCLALDEKAQLAVMAKNPLSVNPSTAMSQHKEILRQLSLGQVVASMRLGEEQGSSPFRQVFSVLLVDESGWEVEAVFKPIVAGDKHNRWARAPAEWVAYQMASLLGLDVVPPAVMRRDVCIEGKNYPSGVMVYSVPDLKPLNDVPAEQWGETVPSALVSNVHVLDALLGSAPRKKEGFKAGKHWAGVGEVRPCLIEHPMGPRLGDLHSMWSRRGDTSHGVESFSPETLSKLKTLSRGSLLESMSGALSAEEMEVILEKRDQVVAYFEALVSRAGRHLTVR